MKKKKNSEIPIDITGCYVIEELPRECMHVLRIPMFDVKSFLKKGYRLLTVEELQHYNFSELNESNI